VWWIDETSRSMRSVAPSVIAASSSTSYWLGGVDREVNIVSAAVEAVTRLVVV
jgi:hypothetical protein